MGLTSICKKTKHPEVTRRSANSRILKVDDLEFERVREFKYLGPTLTKIITSLLK
jgi:hypothetical protein